MANNWKYWLRDGSEHTWGFGDALPADCDWTRADFLNQFALALRERYVFRYGLSSVPSAVADNIVPGHDVQSAAWWNGVFDAAKDMILAPPFFSMWYIGSEFPASGTALPTYTLSGLEFWGTLSMLCFFSSHQGIESSIINEPAQVLIDSLPTVVAGDVLDPLQWLRSVREICGLARILYVVPKGDSFQFNGRYRYNPPSPGFPGSTEDVYESYGSDSDYGYVFAASRAYVGIDRGYGQFTSDFYNLGFTGITAFVANESSLAWDARLYYAPSNWLSYLSGASWEDLVLGASGGGSKAVEKASGRGNGSQWPLMDFGSTNRAPPADYTSRVANIYEDAQIGVLFKPAFEYE